MELMDDEVATTSSDNPPICDRCMTLLHAVIERHSEDPAAELCVKHSEVDITVDLSCPICRGARAFFVAASGTSEYVWRWHMAYNVYQRDNEQAIDRLDIEFSAGKYVCSGFFLAKDLHPAHAAGLVRLQDWAINDDSSINLDLVKHWIEQCRGHASCGPMSVSDPELARELDIEYGDGMIVVGSKHTRDACAQVGFTFGEWQFVWLLVDEEFPPYDAQRMLAHRMPGVVKTRLTWNCVEMSDCELSDYDWQDSSLMRRYLEHGGDWLSAWFWAVQNCKELDPVIEAVPGRCLFGLWEKDFWLQLLWVVRTTGDRLAKPSWSWQSVSSDVEYHKVRFSLGYWDGKFHGFLFEAEKFVSDTGEEGTTCMAVSMQTELIKQQTLLVEGIVLKQGRRVGYGSKVVAFDSELVQMMIEGEYHYSTWRLRQDNLQVIELG